MGLPFHVASSTYGQLVPLFIHVGVVNIDSLVVVKHTSSWHLLKYNEEAIILDTEQGSLRSARISGHQKLQPWEAAGVFKD